jgi:hypothetical protein
MRDQLNNNPVVQMAVIAVLLLAGGVFFITMMGGGGEEESAGEASAAPAVTAEESLGTAEGTPAIANQGTVEAVEGGAVSAVPPTFGEPPAPVVRAWESGQTVVLLFIRHESIDDRLVRDATAAVSELSNVATFVVPAARIARYSTITGGLGVERVPALVVVSPKSASGGVPTASVRYGFQSREAVMQAVIDAGYRGPTLDYHP